MATEYEKDIYVVEVAYNWRRAEYREKHGPYPETPAGQRQFLVDVDRVVRATPHGRGKGVFWWEPAVPHSPIAGRGMFDDDDNALPVINVFDQPIHDAYPDAVVNTHPALLPAFKGWHAVEDALAAGVKVTGCTVHLATLEVDEGPILAQEAVPVLLDDTVESLHERIKDVERRLYPEVLRSLLEEPGVTK